MIICEILTVLKFKLKVLEENYSKNQYEFEKYSIQVFASIYGIDILEDNIISARERLFNQYFDLYNKKFKSNINQKLLDCIKYILKLNLVQADVLSLKKVKNDKFIIFSEWSLVNDKIKRRDFEFKNLIDYAPFEEGTLFSDLGDQVIIPSPIKEYPLVHFLDIVPNNEHR